MYHIHQDKEVTSAKPHVICNPKIHVFMYSFIWIKAGAIHIRARMKSVPQIHMNMLTKWDERQTIDEHIVLKRTTQGRRPQKNRAIQQQISTSVL